MFSRIKFLFLFLSMPIAAMEPYIAEQETTDTVPSLKQQALKVIAQKVLPAKTNEEVMHLVNKLPEDLIEELVQYIKESDQPQEFTHIAELASIQLSENQKWNLINHTWHVSPNEKYIAENHMNEREGTLINIENGTTSDFQGKFVNWYPTDHNFVTYQPANNNYSLHSSSTGKKIASLNPENQPKPFIIKKVTLSDAQGNPMPIKIKRGINDIQIKHAYKTRAPFEMFSPHFHYGWTGWSLYDIKNKNLISLKNFNARTGQGLLAQFISDQVLAISQQICSERTLRFSSHIRLFNTHNGSLIKKIEFEGKINALNYIGGNICVVRQPNIIELYDNQLHLKKRFPLEGCFNIDNACILKKSGLVIVLDNDKLRVYKLVSSLDEVIFEHDLTQTSLPTLKKLARDSKLVRYADVLLCYLYNNIPSRSITGGFLVGALTVVLYAYLND